MAEKKQSALEQTRRLLEAQRNEVEGDEQVWRALAIEILGIPVVLPIGDVSELAVCENITPVPLTQSWVRGLTNVRGQLFTVVDLSVFLGGPETRLSRDARIIMLGAEGLNSCLLVNNIIGLKILNEEMKPGAPEAVAPNVARYIRGAVATEEGTWAVLDVASMTRDERFRKPARVQARAESAVSV
ncbi:MAG: hypothetical protein DWQ08_10885 [Proteobacteria bacterium]|nr:MAG: hypothetical protein DWQ08_10885 [Pseudomonadota bacterium]